MKTSELGRLGETRAAEYLQRMGHMVIERNWRSAHLEIDIVTLAEDGIHFVEVKSRKAPVSADPLSNITQTKLHNMAKAARCYLRSEDARKKLGHTHPEVMLDVLTVIIDTETTDIHYYPRAYTPIYV